MVLRYAFTGFDKETMAKASARNVDISTKYAVEVCRAIRGLPVSKAKSWLQDAIEMKRAFPIKRYTEGAGHRPGLGAGKFVVKVASQILKVLKSAEANAHNQNIVGELYVLHAAAHKAHRPIRAGAYIGRHAKRTHIEIVVGIKTKDRSKNITKTKESTNVAKSKKEGDKQ